MVSRKGFSLALSVGMLLTEVAASSSPLSSLRAASRELTALKEGAVTLVKPGDGVHTVRVRQTLVGSKKDGCDKVSPKKSADMLFAIYLDPDTLEETCGIFQRDASPCFQETVAIGCDPLTNTATISVYVRDITFSGRMRTKNPRLGHCQVGLDDTARKTILISETFECNGGPGPNTCSDTHDDCEDGYYCNFSEVNGYECKSYVPVGASCGGFTLPGEDSRCNPDEAYCRDTEYCIVADTPGTCAAYFGDCASDSDCSDPTTLFCDTENDKCKERLVEGDCCADFGPNSCGADLVCPQNEEGGLEWTAQCEPDGGIVVNPPAPPCNPECAPDEECAFSEMDSDFFCRPYLAIGDTCGLVGIPGSVPNCNPKEAFCDFGNGCYNIDSEATCVAFTSEVKTCASIDDCPTEDSWCDKGEGRCKPKKNEDICCESSGECSSGLACVGLWFDEISAVQKVCRPLCETTEDCPQGEWCASGAPGDNKFCKPYAEEGEGCQFFTMASLYEICDPSTHFCRDESFCIVSDAGGTCEPLGAPCTATTDCQDPVGEYCDTSSGYCKPRVAAGYCCFPENAEDQCEGGVPCTEEGKCEGGPDGGPVIPFPPVDLCNNQFCGGIAGIECTCGCKAKGHIAICVDNPRDDCDPANGGADCGGSCICALPEKPWK